MNKEALLKRKDELIHSISAHKANLAKFEEGAKQAEANIQACTGAIQDCDHWLEQIALSETKVEETTEEEKVKANGKTSRAKKELEVSK